MAYEYSDDKEGIFLESTEKINRIEKTNNRKGCCDIPPCHYCIRPCREGCEESYTCRVAGTCGSKWGNDNRVNVMGCGLIISVIALTLQIVAMLAMANNIPAIQDTAWSVGRADIGTSVVDSGSKYRANEVEFYIGMSQLVYCVDNTCKKVKYEECAEADFCTGTGHCVTKFCEECMYALDATDDLVVFAVLLGIPQLFFEVQRLAKRSDLNCSKVWGIIASLIGCIVTIAALAEYEEGCAVHLGNQAIYFDDYEYLLDWNMGPGSICLLISCFLKIYGVFVHVIVPTPHELHVETYEMDKVDWKEDYVELDEPWMKSAHEDAGVIAPHRRRSKTGRHHNQDPTQNKQP